MSPHKKAPFFQRKYAKWQRRRKSKQAEIQFQLTLQQIGPEDICLDCGANVGEITQVLAQTGCTVHAFEPEPNCFATLQKKFADSPNVILVNAAVGVEEGEVSLYMAPSGSHGSNEFSQTSSVIKSKNNIDTAHEVRVKQIDLFEYMAAIGHPVRLLKLDIEGAEVPILEKMFSAQTAPQIEHLFAELHEKQIPEMASRFSQIRKMAQEQDAIIANLDWR